MGPAILSSAKTDRLPRWYTVIDSTAKLPATFLHASFPTNLGQNDTVTHIFLADIFRMLLFLPLLKAKRHCRVKGPPLLESHQQYGARSGGPAFLTVSPLVEFVNQSSAHSS